MAGRRRRYPVHLHRHLVGELQGRAGVTDPDALAAWIKRRLLRKNPAELSESDALDMALVSLFAHDIHEQEAQRLVEAARDKLTALLAQVRRGVHHNPTLLVASGNPRRRIARTVLSIAYVHDEDGEEYEHDFTEDRDHGAVAAYVERGGRRVVLEATDGQPIVKDY